MNALAALPLESGVYLASYLSALTDVLSDPEVTDIYVNRPGEIWVETLGGQIQCRLVPGLDELTLSRLARQIAALTHQGVSREHPLLGATLPDGSRIQIVNPPATRGPICFAIRRQVAPSLTLGDYAGGQHFRSTRTELAAPDDLDGLRSLIAKGEFVEALRLAVRDRKNILISGGTSTGKTTFLNALVREVPIDERLILIEDTPEIVVEQPNAVGLVSVRGELGEAKVTTNDLVSAALRMRPDRIIVGELRGPEAFSFLRAVRSGHPGSMTTIHADSPQAAVEQLVMLVLHTGTNLSRDDVRHYVAQSIDLFVHLARTGGERLVEALVLSEARRS